MPNCVLCGVTEGPFYQTNDRRKNKILLEMATKNNIAIDNTGWFCGKCIKIATGLKNDRYLKTIYNVKKK